MLEEQVGNSSTPAVAFTVDPRLDCFDATAIEFSTEVPWRVVEERIGICIPGLGVQEESGVDWYVWVQTNRMQVGHKDWTTSDFDMMQSGPEHLARAVGCFVGPKNRHTTFATECVVVRSNIKHEQSCTPAQNQRSAVAPVYLCIAQELYAHGNHVFYPLVGTQPCSSRQ
jgi:hypothetical protein